MSQAPLSKDAEDARPLAPSLRIDEDVVADLSRYAPSLNFLSRLR
jgi:hypothetical protein